MSSQVQGSTVAGDRIPLGQKFAYASGMLVNNLQAAALPAMMVVLNLGLGLSPILLGVIASIPRIFDAVSDPMMGYISDNTRTRWGRRRPYIFAGAIISGLVFIGMWQVPTGWPLAIGVDTDRDGISDVIEREIGTDPFNVNDPVVDGGKDEINETGPEDSISDAMEVALIRQGAPAPVTMESVDANGDKIPDYDESRQSYYFWGFLVALVLFYLTYTVYATPFVAFGYEMTTDYHERTRLHAFANTAGQLAWIGAPWIWWGMSQYDDKVAGASQMGFAFGLVIMLLGVVPAFFCREREETFEPSDSTTGISGVFSNLAEFFRNLASALKCSPFVKLCSATFLVFNGYQLGLSFSLYVIIYYVYGGVDDGIPGQLNGWWGSLTALFTIGVIPLTAILSGRYGKKRTFMITISLSIIGYAFKWIGYDPAWPYLLLASCPLVAFGTGSLFTLMGSMIGDVCDYDELESKQRREGVFGAIYWWMVKVGMAAALMATGLLLEWAGFVTPPEGSKEVVVQSADTLFWLRVFDIGIPIITSCLALVIMSTYEITETRANEIQAELEERCGKLES